MNSTLLNGLVVAISTLGLLPAGALAETTAATDRNWPAWRGPRATGAAPLAQPPTTWSETQNVKWKVALPGKGTASPVVWDELVFILTAIPSPESGSKPVEKPAESAATEGARPGGGGRPRGGGGSGGGGGMTEAPTVPQKFTVLALDRQTGKIVWERSPRTELPHEGHHKDHGFASASPVTDGSVLVASFGSYGIYAYDLTGKLLWEKQLGKMRTRNGFGEGSSPALDGDTVVVLWDHEGDDFIVALDKRTGKELWRKLRDEPTGWCTPLIVSHGGRKQAVVNATGKVRSYDLATGDVVWEAGGQTANAIPTAVADADHVYVMSGFRGAACQAITLGRRGDLTGTEAVSWSLNKGTPYVPSPLLTGGRLYFYAGNNAQLTICDTTTGKPSVDVERLDGLTGVYASPVSANGRVYLTGRDGGMLVIKEGAALEVLSKNRLDDGFDSTPALAGKDLFLRGRESLYCLSETAVK